jgi:transposase
LAKIVKEPLNTNLVEKEIESLEKELNDLKDEEAQHFVQLATSVTGIGAKTARMLLIYTNGFNGFDQAGKVVKYSGIAPSIHQLGSSVRMRARITKNGPAALRASLYMAANAARRFNNACKTLFERLRKKGKPYKSRYDCCCA